MADTIGYRVSGLSRVVRDLVALGVDVDDLKDALAAIAALGAVTARKHIPKQSGRLAGDARGNRAKSKAVVTIGRASIPYAGPINYGWPKRNIAPANYVAATDAEMEPVAIGLLERDINRAISKRGLA